MSMAAKLSDLGDKMSEDQPSGGWPGRKASPRSSGPVQEMEEEDGSPHNSPTWSPVQRPPLGLPQYKTLLRNMSDFNR